MNNAESLGTPQLVLTVAMTLLVQSLTAMAMAVPSVLAPVAAADVGVAPTRVGIWAGTAFLSAMYTMLASRS